MEKQITCINCPVGCRLTVTLHEGQVTSVSGNTCIRGDKYARQEAISPERMITAAIPVAGSPLPLSVKTSRPIPKRLIDACMAALADANPQLPIRIGDVILENVLGTGADIVATRTLE